MGGSPVHQGQESQDGIVEVCSDGRWGKVQTSQPQQVAREVCKRLNFNEMNEITSNGKNLYISHKTIIILVQFLMFHLPNLHLSTTVQLFVDP